MRYGLIAAVAVFLFGGAVQAAPLPAPYKSEAVNFAYNLLFCDTPALFLQNKSLASSAPLYRVLHAKPADAANVRKIANDDHGDSCTRMLAFDWLRAHKLAVPPKVLLGAVAELGSSGGPDTVAVYTDGNIRFISAEEKLASFGPDTPKIAAKAQELLSHGRELLPRLDPWKEPRVPAAPFGIFRITFLTSDGLHFGDGEARSMAHDKFGGTTVRTAIQLLRLGYDAAEK
jgi:hypothetical protein